MNKIQNWLIVLALSIPLGTAAEQVPDLGDVSSVLKTAGDRAAEQEGIEDAGNVPVPQDTPTAVLPKLQVAADSRANLEPSALYPQLLEKNQGIFLGEFGHGDDAIGEHVHKALPGLSQNGVRQLYIEFVRSKDQAVLDRFNEKGDNIKEVEQAIEAAGFSAGSYLDLIQLARDKGMKVYGIDVPEPVQDRSLCNPHWASVVREHAADLGPGERYAIFAGAGHAGRDPGDQIPDGVDRLLGIPSIRFQSAFVPPKTDKEKLLNDLYDIPPKVTDTPEMPKLYQGKGDSASYILYLRREKL